MSGVEIAAEVAQRHVDRHRCLRSPARTHLRCGIFCRSNLPRCINSLISQAQLLPSTRASVPQYARRLLVQIEKLEALCANDGTHTRPFSSPTVRLDVCFNSIRVCIELEFEVFSRVLQARPLPMSLLDRLLLEHRIHQLRRPRHLLPAHHHHLHHRRRRAAPTCFNRRRHASNHLDTLSPTMVWSSNIPRSRSSRWDHRPRCSTRPWSRAKHSGRSSFFFSWIQSTQLLTDNTSIWFSR